MATKREQDRKAEMEVEQEIIRFFHETTEGLQKAKRDAEVALEAKEGEGAGTRRRQALLPLGGPLDDYVARVGTYFHDDYVFIDPYGDLVDKRHVLQRMQAGSAIFDTVILSDLDVRVYGDVAVITNKLTYKGTRDGRVIDSVYAETHTWQRQKEGWLMHTTHMNRIQPQKTTFVSLH